MSAPARINLVLLSPISETESDVRPSPYVAADSVYSDHDEIEFVAPNGEQAAVVMSTGYADTSIVYEYTDGSLGSSKRRTRHRINLAVDYITDAIRSKLERWMRRKDLVAYCPGYGRHTTLAHRPIPGIGSNMLDGTTPYTDLTGRWPMATTGKNAPVWDADLRVVRAPDGLGTTNKRRLIPTRAGTSQVFERVQTSRFQPLTPLSDVEGNDMSSPMVGDSGWTKWGTHSADIDFTFVAGGFGAMNAYNSLIVSADNATSRVRGVIASSLWDSEDENYQGYEFTGSYRATLSIWLRGRVGAGATVSFIHGANVSTVDLDELDLSQWTKVSLSLLPYNNDWEQDIPAVLINLSSGSTAGGAPRLEIGPTRVLHNTTAASQLQPELGDLADLPRDSVTGFTFPAAGSMYASFLWPSAADLSDGSANLVITSAGGNVGRIYVTETSVAFVPKSGATLSGSITPTKNAIHTICVVWGGTDGKTKLYYDGELLAESAAGADIEIADATTTVYFGQHAWPLLPLTWRIDRELFTAQKVAEIDTTLRDTTCNDLSVHARGRGYIITEIPSTPRNQHGGTVWYGGLTLEEYVYDHNRADLISEDM